MEKKEGPEINYLFFSSLLFFLIALTFSHFFRMNTPIWGAPLYFLLYALGQALLEVLCFMLIGYLIHRYLPSWIFKLYIGFSFALLLAHFINYTIVRLMDTSISYIFNFFFGCGLDHFRTAFSALNLTSTVIETIIGILILVPLLGIVFYWLTHKITKKAPLHLSTKQILSAVTILTLSLFSLDIVAKPYITNSLYNKYSKTLPLGSTFLPPSFRRISLPSLVRHARSEPDLQNLLTKNSFACAQHPNIFIFVIETLRRDFITKTIAPNIDGFSKAHPSPAIANSNANSTHLSWFAIFHSDIPYQWTEVRDQWTRGSVPLQILKKMGYRIRVYAAADLAYFNMDQNIFGKERYLADSIKDFSTIHQIEPCDRDELSMKAAMQDATIEKEGNLFIVFLDSTHSEYSTPQNFEHPFQPAATFIDYLAISKSSSELELLKNRYRNAIHWVDHLFGSFMQLLKEKDLYQDAIIVVTGDHGEEFFEEGALFHGTHLNNWQTNIPLFYKLPLTFQYQAPLPAFTTHLDIMPTILHCLSNQSEWDEYFDGQSLYSRNRSPYIIKIQHNGHDVPYEFMLSLDANKLTARFLNPPLIHTVPSIELLSLETSEKSEVELTEKSVKDLFPNAFSLFLQD